MLETSAARNGRPRLVLLIDADPSVRREIAPLLVPSGLELVQARDGAAALEILERLPDPFRVVLVSLDLPGLPGRALIQTLRLFRPELPLVCLSGAPEAVAGDGSCLAKPVQPESFREQLAGALDRRPPHAIDGLNIRPEALDRAKAIFAESRSLVDAAREIARGLSDPLDVW
jgi:CheY-like chemotaxis protein